MKKRVLLHILFWLVYVFFKAYLNYTTTDFADMKKTEFEKLFEALIPQLFYLIVKIPLVYALFFVINNYFSKRWKIFKVIIVTFFLIVFAVFIYIIINHYIVLNWFLKNNFSFSENLILGSVLYSLFILVFAAGIAVTIKLIRMNIHQNRVSQEILKMKLETELNLLKSQINPHFLFNTLNNVYSLAIKKSEHTAPVVMRLSKLLRFMLYESNKEQIFIIEEIKLLEDYIELEKIRYTDKLTINIEKSISTPTEKITPLLLLPLVENGFKHGASESTKAAFITIKIIELGGILNVSIINSKEEEETKTTSKGIGLKNVQRQLELTYGEFRMDIKDEEDIFEVKLMINLRSYEKN